MRTHPLPTLDRGETYNWEELQTETYFDTGFGTGGGIKVRPDSDNPEYIILFGSEDGIYANSISDDQFKYIGQGRPENGDQSEDRYTNASLIRAIEEDIAVYFFYREEKGDDWTFRGLVDVLDYDHRYREDEDRTVLVFDLEFVDADAPAADDDGADTLPEPDTDDQEDTRDHIKQQYYLIQLGLEHEYDVYVAKNDKGASYNGDTFSDLCVDDLQLSGIQQEARDIIEYVDVVWLKNGVIKKMFEVESTTSIYSGILRMTDFVTTVPNLAVDMYIVAPEDDTEKVHKQMNRPTFSHILTQLAEPSQLQHLSFDEVERKYDLVTEHGPLLEPLPMNDTSAQTASLD